MPRKRTTRAPVAGDVNVENGDVVAGDKTTVVQAEAVDINASDLLPERPRKTRRKRPKGDIDVSGGDVVLDDKIIKFMQDNLNIYVFKDVRQVTLFLAALIAVVAVVAGAIWVARQPRRMTGNFNIAVAQFGEIAADGSLKPSANAEKISRTLFDFLDSEYRASGLGMTVQITHKNMPLVIEQAQAEALAAKVGAHIVIFGSIYVQGERAEFSPRFYVAEQSDTRELTGQNELAFPIPFSTSDLASTNEVHALLRARTRILLNFTRALIYFSDKRYEQALPSINSAIAAAEELPASFAGQEALHLLAAKIQIERGQMEAAGVQLDRALALNPDYARAYLGRGNLFYIQAVDSNYEPALLEQALAQYTLAYESPDQPEGAYIPVKAHTGLGDVLVVRAQQTNDPAMYARAEAHYSYVLEEYRRTKDPFLKQFAAVAYFGLGAASERQGRHDEAIGYYEQARDLTSDEDFKARVARQIEVVRSY